MTKINRSQDCGNSPKKQFLENVEIAIAKNDIEFQLNKVTADIHWQNVGQKPVIGPEALAEALKGNYLFSEVEELTVDHVFTHSSAGSANGVRKYKDGKTYDFCTVYEFGNAKGTTIRKVMHYAIERS